MSDNEMAYYDIVGIEQQQVWEKYRQDLIAHRQAARELATEIGAGRFWLGFGGGICGALFEERRHAAFSATKRSRGGYHPLMARGKTAEQKEAIAFMAERNQKLAAMYPEAREIATKEGFIHSMQYRDPGSDTFNGVRCIGYVWERCQPLWAGIDQPITLYATAGDLAIAYEKARGKETNPAEWSIPPGYVRIHKEEWELRLAQYKLERVKAGQKVEDDE